MASELGVAKDTLLGWRKTLSDAGLTYVRDPSEPGEHQVCKNGGGRKHYIANYEESVVAFCDDLNRKDTPPTHAAILSYCRTFEQFAAQNVKTQRSWVHRS